MTPYKEKIINVIDIFCFQLFIFPLYLNTTDKILTIYGAYYDVFKYVYIMK